MSAKKMKIWSATRRWIQQCGIRRCSPSVILRVRHRQCTGIANLQAFSGPSQAQWANPYPSMKTNKMTAAGSTPLRTAGEASGGLGSSADASIQPDSSNRPDASI